MPKMQKESRERIDREERQKIEAANIETGENPKLPTYESITEIPDYLEKIKEIELGTNLISLEEELGGLYP